MMRAIPFVRRFSSPIGSMLFAVGAQSRALGDRIEPLNLDLPQVTGRDHSG
jgi:hypothetical protein